MDYTQTFDSIEEAAKAADRHHGRFMANMYGGWKKSFFGVSTWDIAKKMARDGWSAEVKQVMAVVEEAIATVEAELDSFKFRAEWDMSGCEVDVGRYLSGVPECMIEYEVTPTTKYGRVITLCASTAVSAAVSTAAIKRRGHAVAALAFALAELGYATEIWADHSASDNYRSGNYGRTRVLIKGPNDELDPSRIMFALAHPAFSRGIGIGSMYAFPKELIHDGDPLGYGHGSPTNPKQDLPEGTIYLPCVFSDHDVPNADVALRKYLRDLGIVE